MNISGANMQISNSNNKSYMTSIHSRSIKPENGNARLKKLNPDKVISETKNNGVELTISKDARRLLEQHLGNSAEQIFSSNLDSIHEGIAQREIYEKAMAEFHDNELFDVRTLYSDLYKIVSSHDSNGKFRSATTVFTELSNKYAEMRSWLEERFIGEELEKKLDWLNRAFENAEETYAWLLAEESRFVMFYQKQMMENNNIQFNRDQFDRDVEKLMVGIYEAAIIFAQLARQFVIENGAINSEQDKKALETFLDEAPRQQGSFTFNEFNSVNEIMRRSLPRWQEEMHLHSMSASETSINRMYFDILKILQQV